MIRRTRRGDIITNRHMHTTRQWFHFPPGTLRIPCMPAGDSSRCRASVPGDAGPGVSRTLILSLSS